LGIRQLPGVDQTHTVRAETLGGNQSPESHTMSLRVGKPRPCYLTYTVSARETAKRCASNRTI